MNGDKPLHLLAETVVRTVKLVDELYERTAAEVAAAGERRHQLVLVRSLLRGLSLQLDAHSAVSDAGTPRPMTSDKPMPGSEQTRPERVAEEGKRGFGGPAQVE